MRTEVRSHKSEVESWKKKIFFVKAFLLFMIQYLIFTYFAFASQSDEVVKRIQRAYENIQDIKGSFIQKSYIKDLKRIDNYKGDFFIKSPKMRWEYKSEKPQIIYITEEDIIIYQIKEKQAFKTRFDMATYGQAPIALLGGFGNIINEFDAFMKSDNRIGLKPKKPMGNISLIELSLSDNEFPISSITIIDKSSNKIDIDLRNVKINTGLKDSIFNFSPPHDVNIIQH